MSELITQRHPRSDATDTEVQTALTAIALASGNCRKAAETLKEATGIDRNQGTLRTWMNKTYADEYRRVCEEIAPALTERMAQSDDALVMAAHELEWKALERMNIQIEDASANEAANIYGKVAINSGIHTDKGLLRRGQPTEIKQTFNMTDALKKLKAIAPGLVIDSTAEEDTAIAPDLDRDPNRTDGVGFPD